MFKQRIKPNTPVIYALLIAMLPLAVHAHKGATGIVKQRMDAMSEMGDALGTMGDIVKGKRPFDVSEVISATQLLAHHAEGMNELFPDTHDSRNGHMTEALPVIWEDWGRFIELSDALANEIESLRSIAVDKLDEQTLRRVFRKTARACSACHDDFRKPKD